MEGAAEARSKAAKRYGSKLSGESAGQAQCPRGSAGEGRRRGKGERNEMKSDGGRWMSEKV